MVAALVEGASINSTVRMTNISKPTILKLLADLGAACKKYQDEKLRNLPCMRVQCDEIWSFCFAKDKNAPEKLRGQFGFGSIWTWTALCADTKLMVNWLVGNRDGDTACTFIEDLAGRLAHRVQLSTVGHKPYLEAVKGAFGADIDYAMVIKMYSNAPTGNETRYSPTQCCGIAKARITGSPDMNHASTGYAERMNLQIRMGMRRFTRLTNAQQKDRESPSRLGALLHVLQLRSYPFKFTSDASDGSWHFQSCLEYNGNGRRAINADPK